MAFDTQLGRLTALPFSTGSFEMTVYTKLNEARKQFHALELKKTGHNKFAGYYYFELGDFLIPALKVFNAVGLCAVVSFYEKTARMVILDVTAPPEAERICIDSPMGSAALKGCHEVQNIGAVETYQRRYLWVAALEIVEHDALDSSEPVKDQPGSLENTLKASIEHVKGKKDEVNRTLVMKVRTKIQEHVTADRPGGVAEEWDYARSVGEDFQSGVWAGLTTPEREYIREVNTNRKETT